jgi:ribosomal protein L21E
MGKGKKIRTQGKLKLSCYFKKFKEGERVAIVKDLGIKNNFPKRIVGMSGTVEGLRGKYCLVKLKDGSKNKVFIIHPIHLRSLK